MEQHVRLKGAASPQGRVVGAARTIRAGHVMVIRSLEVPQTASRSDTYAKSFSPTKATIV